MKAAVCLALAALAAGCSRKPEPPKQAAPVYFRVDPAEAASIQGDVLFEGKAPAARKISMDSEEACASQHPGGLLDQKVVVGKQHGLANVFVYVKTGLEGKTFPPPEQAVVLDQRGCWFVPRIVPLRTGQTLDVKNSDPVSHNIHPMPSNNRDWNQQQAPGAPDLKRHFARPEVMIPVKCNIHSWMRCYIGVLEHPFFAVTGPDGKFSIEGLPPGEYTLAAWHETLGEIAQKVVLRKSDKAESEFVYR